MVMDLAHTSRYWASYRASKTFRLTITIYEAHLGFSNGSTSQGDPPSTSGLWDTLAAVYLSNSSPKRRETSKARKTANPVWDESFAFEDVDFSEQLRIEVRGVRKLGENPVLGTLDLEVYQVMEHATNGEWFVFRLECDCSRIRYGVVLVAFDVDPPVPSDVLVGLGGAPTVQADEWVAREISPAHDVEHPVYINVEGHFACLLLDDDGPANVESKALLEQSPTNAVDLSNSSRYRGSAPIAPLWPCHPDGLPVVACSPDHQDPRSRNGLVYPSQQRGANGGLSISRNGHVDFTGDRDTMGSSHAKTLQATEGVDSAAGGRGKRRDRRARPSSVGSSMLSSIHMGVPAAGLGRAGSVGSIPLRASRDSIVKPRRMSCTGGARQDGAAAAAEEAALLANDTGANDATLRMKHRSRRRFKQRSRTNGNEPRSDGRVGLGGSNNSPPPREDRGGKPRRPRSWTDAILRSPTLGGSLTRALNPGSRRGERGRAKSDAQSTPKSDAVTDSSTVALNEDESLSDVAREGGDSDSICVGSIHERLKLAAGELIRQDIDSS